MNKYWEILNPLYVLDKATGELLKYSGEGVHKIGELVEGAGIQVEAAGVKLEDLGEGILKKLEAMGDAKQSVIWNKYNR